MQKKISKNTQIYFIKLGEAGCKEKECIKDNHCIYFGFDDETHEACLEGHWKDVYTHYTKTSPQQATTITKRSRIYYEAAENVIFITFYGGDLWWCKPTGRPILREGGGNYWLLLISGIIIALTENVYLFLHYQVILLKCRCIVALFVKYKSVLILFAGLMVKKYLRL